MKAGKMLALLSAALLIGALGADVAVAKKKKKRGTAVVFNNASPSVSQNGRVRARGSLKASQDCRFYRGMKLLLTDAGGGVLAVLDSKTADRNGNFRLSGRLTNRVRGTAISVRVKAIKKATKRSFCRAGFSQPIQLIIP